MLESRLFVTCAPLHHDLPFQLVAPTVFRRVPWPDRGDDEEVDVKAWFYPGLGGAVEYRYSSIWLGGVQVRKSRRLDTDGALIAKPYTTFRYFLTYCLPFFCCASSGSPSL